MPAAALQPSDTKVRFGKHQDYFVVGVDVDRTSLATVRIEMHVSDEGLNNFNTNFLTLGFGLAVAGEAGVTDLLEIPEDNPTAICVGINRRYERDQSTGIYTYTFEGLLADRTPYYEFELEFAMNQEPIETHPNWEEIDATFGPYDPINRVWQRIPTKAQTQAGGLSGPSNAGQIVTNPLFGTTSFLSPGAVYRISYTDIDIHEGDLDGIGTKDEPQGLGDQFPEFQNWMDSNRRDWLKMAPRLRKRGGAVQVTLEWLLSGPRGWEEALYSDAAINGSPGSGANVDQGGNSTASSTFGAAPGPGGGFLA